MRSEGSQGALAEQLAQWVSQTPSLMALLRAVRPLELPCWAIGAGAVRNLVWDRLHGYADATPLQDVDVVYFDPDNTSSAAEQTLQQHLGQCFPAFRWEVTNQAAVHLWYEQAFGLSVAP